MTKEESKLIQLTSWEGFSNVDEMISATVMDSVCPGICINEDCNYTSEVEPDCSSGWCEECDEGSVKSCLVLAGII